MLKMLMMSWWTCGFDLEIYTYFVELELGLEVLVHGKLLTLRNSAGLRPYINQNNIRMDRFLPRFPGVGWGTWLGLTWSGCPYQSFKSDQRNLTESYPAPAAASLLSSAVPFLLPPDPILKGITLSRRPPPFSWTLPGLMLHPIASIVSLKAMKALNHE